MPHLSCTPLCCSVKHSSEWGDIGLTVTSYCQIPIGAGWIMQQPWWTKTCLFDTLWVQHLSTDIMLLVRWSRTKVLLQDGELKKTIRKRWNPSRQSIKIFFSQWTFTESGSFALLQPKCTNAEHNPVPTLASGPNCLSGIIPVTSNTLGDYFSKKYFKIYLTKEKLVKKTHMLPLALCQLKC